MVKSLIAVVIAVSVLAVGCTTSGSGDTLPAGQVSEWERVDTGLGVMLDLPAEWVDWEMDTNGTHSWRAWTETGMVSVFVGNNTQTQATPATRLSYFSELNEYTGRQAVEVSEITLDGHEAVRAEFLESADGTAGGPLTLDLDNRIPGGAIEWYVFPSDIRKIEIKVFSETYTREDLDHVGSSVRIISCIPWSDDAC